MAASDVGILLLVAAACVPLIFIIGVLWRGKESDDD